MRTLRSFVRRFRNVFRREELDRDLSDELASHLAMHIEDNVRAGMSQQEARRAALLKLGGVEQVKESHRERRGLPMLESVWQDLRFAVRMLGKSPGFTFLAVLCLALGIGVNTSVFTVLDVAMLRPMPVSEPESMTILSRAGSPLISYPDYLGYRDRNHAFTALGATLPTESSLDANDENHLAAAEAVSGNYSETLGLSAFLGRWFTNENADVAVLSYATWRHLFNADPRVLGKRVRSESQSYTVIGVARPEFTGIYTPLQTDIWVPLRVWTKQYPEARAHLLDRAHPWPSVMIIGRLKPRVAVSQAAADLNGLDAQIRHENPTATASASAPLVLEIIHGAPSPVTRRGAVPFVTLLFLVVGVVLLIACVNVGNLLLARGTARQQELSVRSALGASRARLLRQLLAETLLLSLLGTAGGLLLGKWTNHLLNALFESLPVDTQVSLHLDLSLDSRVFAFALGLSFLCTLACGLFPAWRAVSLDVYPILKGGGTSPRQRVRLRYASLVAQVALSLILLLCSGLFLRSIYRMRAADPGFAVDNRLYVLTYISAPEFTDATGLQFYSETLERLRNLPGVRNAAVTRFLPLLATGQETDCLSAGTTAPFNATLGVISPGFLATMQIPLLEGRDFNSDDGPNSPPAVLVSQNLAKHLWPQNSAVGQHLRFGCDNDAKTAEVVGVVRDTSIRSLGELPQAHFYRPFAQRYTGLATLVVETSMGGQAAAASAIRSTLRAESSGVRIYALESLASHVERSYWMVRWETSVLFLFGFLALLLAAVGLYGVMAFHAAQRTQEIGLRMALGARPREVYGLIMREGMKITFFGVVLGLAVSVGLTRLLARFLSGLSPTDPLTFTVAALLWVSVALLACYVPARRATRVDPMAALRYE
jgi:predicted permease